MKGDSRMRRTLAVLFVLACAGARPRAGELQVIAGVEPLKSQINDNKESVRLLFMGSPT